MLITIGGLYGSGGQEIAIALKEKLGYDVYEGEIIEQAVKDSGLDMARSALAFYDETDAAIDEKIAEEDPYTRAIMHLQMDVLPIGQGERGKIMEHKNSGLLSSFLNSAPVNVREGTYLTQRDEIDAVRFAQARLILEAADKGNAIFIGRCAGYILKGRPDALNIFTCASLESCRKQIRAYYDIPDNDKIDVLIKTTNRRRSVYYETFTGQKWDDIENYDLCINTDFLGLDGTLDMILGIIEQKSKALG